jgi:hypothetical protein
VDPSGAGRSHCRPGLRCGPEVPREQAQQVEGDSGFTTARRLLEPGKEAGRG